MERLPLLSRNPELFSSGSYSTAMSSTDSSRSGAETLYASEPALYRHQSFIDDDVFDIGPRENSYNSVKPSNGEAKVWNPSVQYSPNKKDSEISIVDKLSGEQGQASTVLTGCNVLILIEGIGILGIPYAVKEGGLAAVAAISLMGYFSGVTGILLVDCLYTGNGAHPSFKNFRKRVRENYSDIGNAVWSQGGGKTVSFVHLLESFSVSILYLVLLTKMFAKFTAPVLPEVHLYSWAVICAVAVLPSVYIKYISLIAWLGLFATISFVAALLAMIVHCITLYSEWQWSNIPPWDTQTIPVALGIIMFSYSTHALFPRIEGCMKYPKRFNSMIHTSFVISAIIKVLFAFLCVLAYGCGTDELIVLNMTGNIAYIVTALVAFHTLCSFPLPLYTVFEAIDDKLLPHFPTFLAGKEWLWIFLTRTLVVNLALFLAILVPHFGFLAGIIGSYTSTCLSFIFPCIAHLYLKWKYLRWYHIAGESFIILFGLVAGVVGIVHSIIAIHKSFDLFY